MSAQEQPKNHGREKKRCVEKIFEDRPSLLTELLEVKHFKTMRHIFVVILVGFFCNDITAFFLETEEVNFGFRAIKVSFGKFHIVVMVWLVLFEVSMLAHPLFKFWADGRQSTSPQSLARGCCDKFWLSVLVFYYFGSLYLAATVTVKFDLPVASSAVVLMEQIRFIMKCHAYVRSNAPKVLSHKPHSDATLELPSFSTFLYFYFVPTLVYRDYYPRTAKVNWNYAIWCFIDVFILLWLSSFVFDKYFTHKFKHTGRSEIRWNQAIVAMFENSLPSFLMMLLMFFLVLHSWMNGFAELLRFADRRFYDDWWTSTNISEYYRTWNIVIQDWLFAYVYKDVSGLTTSKNKFLPKLAVLLLSAVIHEYILCFMLKLFLPVLFIQFFVFGTVLTHINTKQPIFNVLFLYALGLGNSIQMNLYTMEYYARSNCAVDNYNITSQLQPRILTINCS